MGQCVSELKIPASVPFYISCGIGFVSFVIIFICYWYQQKQLNKKHCYKKVGEHEEKVEAVEPVDEVTAVQGTTMDADGKVAQTPIKIFVKSRKNTPQALSQNIASPHASPVATTPALPPQSLVVKSTQEVTAAQSNETVAARTVAKTPLRTKSRRRTPRALSRKVSTPQYTPVAPVPPHSLAASTPQPRAVSRAPRTDLTQFSDVHEHKNLLNGNK